MDIIEPKNNVTGLIAFMVETINRVLEAEKRYIQAVDHEVGGFNGPTLERLAMELGIVAQHCREYDALTGRGALDDFISGLIGRLEARLLEMQPRPMVERDSVPELRKAGQRQALQWVLDLVRERPQEEEES